MSSISINSSSEAVEIKPYTIEPFKNDLVKGHFLPEQLLSLVLEKMDRRSLLQMALTSKEYGTIVAERSGYQNIKEILKYIDFVIDELVGLQAANQNEIERLSADNAHIDRLMNEIEGNKEAFKNPHALDDWMMQLTWQRRGEVYPIKLADALRAFVEDERRVTKNHLLIPDAIIAHLDTLKAPNRERIKSLEAENSKHEKLTQNFDQAKLVISIHGTEPYFTTEQGEDEVPSSADLLNALNFKERDVAISRTKTRLVRYLKEIPAETLARISNKYERLAFVHALSERLPRNIVQILKRELEAHPNEAPFDVLNRMRTADALPKDELNKLLMRSEINHLRGTDFQARKNEWEKNLRTLSWVNADQRTEIYILRGNTPDKLTEHIESRPECLSFFGEFALKKICAEIRESAFVDPASIAELKAQQAYDGSRGHGQLPEKLSSDLLIRKMKELKVGDSQKEDALIESFVDHLLAYGLIDKADDLLGAIADIETRRRVWGKIRERCVAFGRDSTLREHELARLSRLDLLQESDVRFAIHRKMGFFDILYMAIEKLQKADKSDGRDLTSAQAGLAYLIEECLARGLVDQAEALLASIIDQNIYKHGYEKLIKHYEALGLDDKVRQCHLNYLHMRPKLLNSNDVSRAYANKLTLGDISHMAVAKLKEADLLPNKEFGNNEISPGGEFRKGQETLAYIINLWLSEGNIDRAKELLVYMEGPSKATALARIGEFEFNQGNKEQGVTLCALAFELATNDDKIALITAFRVNEELFAELLQHDSLTAFDKAIIHTALARKVEQREAALMHLTSAMKLIRSSQTLGNHANLLQTIVKQLIKQGHPERANRFLDTIKGHLNSQVIRKIESSMLRSFIKTKNVDEAIELAKKTSNIQALLPLVDALLLEDVAKALEIASSFEAVASHLEGIFDRATYRLSAGRGVEGGLDAKALFEIGMFLGSNRHVSKRICMQMSSLMRVQMEGMNYEEALALLSRMPAPYQKDAQFALLLAHWKAPGILQHLVDLDIRLFESAMENLSITGTVGELLDFIRSLPKDFQSRCSAAALLSLEWHLHKLNEEQLGKVFELYALVENPDRSVKDVKKLGKRMLKTLPKL